MKVGKSREPLLAKMVREGKKNLGSKKGKFRNVKVTVKQKNMTKQAMLTKYAKDHRARQRKQGL